MHFTGDDHALLHVTYVFIDPDFESPAGRKVWMLSLQVCFLLLEQDVKGPDNTARGRACLGETTIQR